LSSLTYDALVAELFPRLTGGIRWGLERTRGCWRRSAIPTALPGVHVGGTNGKGSVAAHVESVLRRAGRVAGSTRHRTCARSASASASTATPSARTRCCGAQRLWPAIRRESPSFFEATTAIALLALAEAGVDVAVVEVGLGGRLDSTNVVDPDVVVLTNVSLDHVQLLGPTMSRGAGEGGHHQGRRPGRDGGAGRWRCHDVRRRRGRVGAPLHDAGPAATAGRGGRRWMAPLHDAGHALGRPARCTRRCRACTRR
jgi:dihydrofolate synthase / folylpolyglutamate synthase